MIKRSFKSLPYKEMQAPAERAKFRSKHNERKMATIHVFQRSQSREETKTHLHTLDLTRKPVIIIFSHEVWERIAEKRISTSISQLEESPSKPGQVRIDMNTSSPMRTPWRFRSSVKVAIKVPCNGLESATMLPINWIFIARNLLNILEKIDSTQDCSS